MPLAEVVVDEVVPLEEMKGPHVVVEDRVTATSQGVVMTGLVVIQNMAVGQAVDSVKDLLLEVAMTPRPTTSR